MAASLASSMADSNVYSLNVVGYYNVPLAANQLTMIANQLNTTNNTLNSILFPANPAAADGSYVFKYNGGYTVYDFDGLDSTAQFPNGYWELNSVPDTTATLNPGEGVFYRPFSATTLTFVGEVLQGSLVNTLPHGLAVRSSIVPQAGKVTTDLGVPAEDSDYCYIYNGGYTVYDYDGLDTAPGFPNGYWELNSVISEPTINVGQSFFYLKFPANASTSWVRNFTVQ
jgi:hypothetical protein